MNALDLCTDVAAMTALLERSLPGFAGGRARIEALSVGKVRRSSSVARNPHPITLCFELTVREGRRLGSVSLYAKMFRNGASAACFASIDASQLERPAWGDAVMHLPELDMVLWALPNDPGLPQLSAMLDAVRLHPLLPWAALGVDPCRARGLDVELLRQVLYPYAHGAAEDGLWRADRRLAARSTARLGRGAAGRKTPARRGFFDPAPICRLWTEDLAGALCLVRGLLQRGQQGLRAADVTGGMIFNQRENHFRFHAGPIFANIVLADEATSSFGAWDCVHWTPSCAGMSGRWKSPMRLPTDRIAHIREMVRLKARPATGLAEQPDAAERVAAFVGPIWPLEGHPWEQAIARFSGGAWARREGAVIETLDRAECLGVIPSASSSEAFVPRRASHVLTRRSAADTGAAS